MVREDPGRKLVRRKREFHDAVRKGLAHIIEGDALFLGFDEHAAQDHALGANKSGQRLASNLHIRPLPPVSQAKAHGEQSLHTASHREASRRAEAFDHQPHKVVSEVATLLGAALPQGSLDTALRPRRPQSVPAPRGSGGGGGGGSGGGGGGGSGGSAAPSEPARRSGALQLHSGAAAARGAAAASPQSSPTSPEAHRAAFPEGPAWSLTAYVDHGVAPARTAKSQAPRRPSTAAQQPLKPQPAWQGPSATSTPGLPTVGPRSLARRDAEEGSTANQAAASAGFAAAALPPHRRHSFVQQKRYAMEALRRREIELQLEAREEKRNFFVRTPIRTRLVPL
jgi:hypothetical protein